MLINGIEVPTFDMDTTVSITNRIASALNTLPRYLSFQQPLSDENKVIDILTLVKKDFFDSFSAFEEKYVDVFSNLYIQRNKKVIFKAWIMFNTPKLERFKKNPLILSSFVASSTRLEYFSTEIEGTRWMENISSHIDALKKEIKTHKSDTERRDSSMKVFEEIEEVPNDVFIALLSPSSSERLTEIESLQNRLIEEGRQFFGKREKIEYVWEIQQTASPLEIFNSLVLNNNIPFANINNYYKVFSEAKITSEWLDIIDKDSSILKIFVKILNNENEYDTIEIFIIEKDKNDDVLILPRISVTIDVREYSNPKASIEKVITLPLSLLSQKESSVSGLYFLPTEYFNSYVLGDLIMNDKLFFQISNDESNKATKRKRNPEDQYMYLYFSHPKTGNITFSMEQKFVVKSDLEIRNTFMQNYESSTPYIRINIIKADSLEQVRQFRLLLGKYMYLYKEKLPTIIKIYTAFIPNFGEILVPKTEADKAFQLKYQGTIVPIEASKCQGIRQPTELTKKTEDTYNEIPESDSRKFLLTFPRDIQPEESEGRKYSTDGMNQKQWFCNSPEYPHIGLQENVDDSKEDQPYYICCFKTDQKEKSSYSEYYKGNIIIKATKIAPTNLIKTNKYLNYRQTGVLPIDLSSSLHYLSNTEDKSVFHRMGVDRNKSSFLASVLLASGNADFRKCDSENERTEFLLLFRKTLSEHYPLSLQSTFFQSSPNLDIANSNVYFDPKYYTQLLSLFFDINIYVFNDNSLVLPHFSQSWKKFSFKNKPAIIIYEHFGGRLDNATYPQCELIVLKTENENKVKHKKDVAKNLYQIFSNMTQSYVLSEKQSDCEFLSQEFITSQFFDTYGKCRMVNVSYNNQDVSILTTPLPPFGTKEKQVLISVSTNRANIKDVLELIKNNDGRINHLSSSNDSCISINVVFGNVICDVLISPVPVSDAINHPALESAKIIENEEEREMIEPNASVSLSSFNRNRKFARYLTEYVFWFFALFLQSSHIEHTVKKDVNGKARIYTFDLPDDMSSLLTEFVNNKIVVDSTVKYNSLPPKKLTTDSPFIRDNKIVVSSLEIVKRLVYSLKLELKTPKRIAEYLIVPDIKNYYLDINDFDSYPKQYIFNDYERVLNWMSHKNINYVLIDRINPNTNNSYFFRNALISEDVFLALNVSSLTKAIDIATRWNQNGNIIEPAKSVSSIYTLYVFSSPTSITKQTMSGTSVYEGESDIQIIEYRVDNSPYYTAIMNLSKN